MTKLKKWYVYGVKNKIVETSYGNVEYKEKYEQIISAGTDKEARKKIPEDVTVTIFHETDDEEVL